MEKPENGFYYHYKHDPSKGEYELIGVARHTENDSYLALYRPLYQNEFLKNAEYFARPLEMFLENVEKDGKKMPRFTRITDEKLIAKLTAIRNQMYGN